MSAPPSSVGEPASRQTPTESLYRHTEAATKLCNGQYSGGTLPATTKLTETEQQVKTARENMILAEENLGLVTFSYNEGKASMADVLSAQLSWTQAHTNLIDAIWRRRWRWLNIGRWLVNEMPLKEKHTKNSGIALQSHTGVSLYFSY